MERRSFLKGLIATTVATQLPALPLAAREKISANLYERFAKFRMNGHLPDEFGMQKLDEGVFRVWAYFEPKPPILDNNIPVEGDKYPALTLETRNGLAFNSDPNYPALISDRKGQTVSALMKLDDPETAYNLVIELGHAEEETSYAHTRR